MSDIGYVIVLCSGFRVGGEARTPDLAAAGAAVSTTTDEAGKDR